MRRIVASLAGVSAALLLAGAASAECTFHNKQVMASKTSSSQEAVAMSTYDGATTGTEATAPTVQKTVAASENCAGEDSSCATGTK
ncbi:hypothetical protein [Afifella pfennigii]|uniref:hypothetical protein n=1 Tax=Afifella pfennigii TaxID=209897 RepID=UPI0005562616|nr:hypothetical protein [Afifella pfennigii]